MTPREQYEADRRELSPDWDELGPETRRAYEEGADRHREGWSQAKRAQQTRRASQ